eukprot:UN05288
MFWGFDILCFEDDTFLIAYIDTTSLFYTLLSSDGTIIAFNKEVYNFGDNECCYNDGLFLVKSYFNNNNNTDFINSFLLYYSTGPMQQIALWTGIYFKNHSLIFDSEKPMSEMVTILNCYAVRPILMTMTESCCYILPYRYAQYEELEYATVNATGYRVVPNDYTMFDSFNEYGMNLLISLQHVHHTKN